MARSKKVEAAVEAVEAKVEAVAEAVSEKKDAVKKAAKKTTAVTKKPAAKKTEPAAEASKIIIQYGDGEADTAAFVGKAKADAGVKSAKQVDIYVKPEVNRVYYVIDGEKFGDFALFE